MQEIHFDVIDSTNNYLKQNYQLLDNLTIVSANIQTNGRGRNNRVWYADKDNLLFSILLKEKTTYYKDLSILSAYTILKILESYQIKDLTIKWPNDIYVKDAKICGILLEGISTTKLECLIIGVGLNVNQIDFKEDYLHKPTSMRNQLHQTINLNELKEKIYQALLNLYNNLDQDYYPFITQYDYLKGKECYAFINNQKQLVKVIGIDRDYSLKVELNNEIINIETGEISFHV